MERDGEPLVISAGGDGALRSWRLAGTPGPLARENAHIVIWSLAVVECDGEPLVISAADEGALRSWRLRAAAWKSLGSATAEQLALRRLSFASPLELELYVPAVLLAPAALGFVLYAIKRIWAYPIELRVYQEKQRARLLAAQQERERLEATREADDVVDAAYDPVVDSWQMTDATLSDDEPAWSGGS